MDSLRFIIADDHPLFRTALKTSLGQSFTNCVVNEAESLKDLQDLLISTPDLHMPDAQGFSNLIHLQAQHPDIPVIIISGSESPDVMCRAIDHGAAGFLPKSSQANIITIAINAVLDGARWLPEGVRYQIGQDSKEQKIAKDIASLTPQQFRVVTLLVQGLLNKQIAYELNVSEATVKAHITEMLFSQLEVNPPQL